ncbi:MAG: Ig-like domain-containing protein [Nanoarchaeota archaeon]|nr:Ig-like domain-containing protein [Nanoarchaeota archaeon]
MKRGILVLLFILLLACSVNAVTIHEVTFSPPDGQIFENEVPVSVLCTATVGTDEELSNLTLYMKNNITEGEGAMGWQSKGFADDMPGGGSKTFSISGLNLVNGTYTWNCLAVSNNTNEGGEGNQEDWANSNWTFYITFTTAASDVTPPVCNIPSNPNITVNEDSGSWTLDANMSLDTNITCTDANALTYSITQTGSGGTFSLSNNDMLNFATDANATGTKIVVIEVSDGPNKVYVSAQVIVTAINDPPLASAIPNQNWDQNKNKTIALSEYFSDVDDPSLNYSYAFNSSSPHISAVIKDDGDAVLTPESNWYGSETITFTAYDNANLSFTGNEVTLTVQQANTTTANNPPSIDPVSPTTTDITISVGESQTFTINKSDPDGDPMNVTWYVNGVPQEGKTGDSFTYTAATGDTPIPIKVAVSDGQESAIHNWMLTVKSSQTTNQTAPPADKKTGENVTACGDNKCSSDEDQLSCCSDCGCPEGYTCNAETNKCTKEKKASNIILLAVVLGLFVGGAGVGLYLYKKKQEQEIFGGLANTPFSLPPKGGEVKREELIVKKPQEPVKKAEKVQEKPLKDTKTTSQVLLKNFIITNLKKGKTLEEIKEELHKVGWTDEQINDAYTAAQLDEAFS